ncbi:MAG TPA: polysaccharide biosynthesis/export family protein [Gemmataceae bacterium]|nr:polysaccharide biosynthesis/export family protein [Gemmataceae bacterium]
MSEPIGVRPIGLVVALVLCAAGVGCKTTEVSYTCVPADFPRELDKVKHPAYVVEPPDILIIEANVVPGPGYKVQPFHTLRIDIVNPAQDPKTPEGPRTVVAMVEADGTIDLGTHLGSAIRIRVAGMTLSEARDAIEKKLPQRNPGVSVSLPIDPLRGQRLIRQDGTIELGWILGALHVTGMTLPEVAKAIEMRLAEFNLAGIIAVDVQGYNSKLFYVILDGGGAGQQVVRVPITGNETVLDAIAQVNGLSPVSSTDNIWVARPAPAGGPHQVLPVNWQAVSQLADTGTNYQLMPGDRVYVAAQHLVATDTFLARLLSPVERLLGVTLLGNYTIRSVAGQNVSGFGGP